MRTKLDHREYFEVPSILLLALAYAFWLSFAGIGSPTLWPLVWLGVVFGMMFNPLPVMFRSSRWWLIRSVGELLISGAHRVEVGLKCFTDKLCTLTRPFVVHGLLDGVRMSPTNPIDPTN